MPGIVRRRIAPHSNRNVFLAVAFPSQRRMMILTVPPDALRGAADLPSTRAVQTSEVVVPDGSIELRIELETVEAADVFTSFVADVAAAVTAADDDAGAVQALSSRFNYWRRLLSGEMVEGLGSDAAQGLWGELWVLRFILHPVWGDEVVEAWTGPDRDDNDFRLGTSAVEVKTIRGDRPAVVRITSERQLDYATGTSLYLVAVVVDAHRHGAGESLIEMVDGCLDTVGGPYVPRLRDRLLASGYSDGHRRRYEDTRFSIREVRVFRVDGQFPRLIESMLPSGVGTVAYRLSLDACAQWAVEIDDLSTHLTGG